MARSKLYLSLAAIAAMAFLFSGHKTLQSAGTGTTINVMQVGAKGDGKTNDTSAFDAALRKAAEKGGTVVVPKGEYVIDTEEPLYVRSNVSIVGKSNPVIRFKTLSRNGSFGYEGFDVRGSNISISGLTVNGGNRLIRGFGIHPGSKNITLSHNVIENMTQSSDPDSHAYRATITGVLIYGGTSDIKLEGNVIRGIKAFNKSPVARGVMVYAQDDLPYAQRVSILNNRISDISPRDDADGVYFDMPDDPNKLSNSVVKGNTISNVAKRGIKIAAPGVTVSDNRVTNSFLNNNEYLFPGEDAIPQDMFSGISIYANNVTVHGNVIDGIGSYYAGIEADLGDLKNIVIYNNKITNGSNAIIKNTNGIRLGTIENFKVHDNKLSNMQTGIFSPITDTQAGSIKKNNISKVDFGIRFSLYDRFGYKDSNVIVADNLITARKMKIEALPK
ncbi:nitrous oxide reductase family maturation protein NosD [Paenibacillus sp. NPDC058071]|uniref:right-handed parallel beta-helix repeat-containing protein n=1 Tax=Paenibacillus sp. NPDC058071 TaxID=3346326 RepID=UPI0036D79E25